MQPLTELDCVSSVGPMKHLEEGGARKDLKEKLDPWGTQRYCLFKYIVPGVFIDIMTNLKVIFKVLSDGCSFIDVFYVFIRPYLILVNLTDN